MLFLLWTETTTIRYSTNETEQPTTKGLDWSVYHFRCIHEEEESSVYSQQMTTLPLALISSNVSVETSAHHRKQEPDKRRTKTNRNERTDGHQGGGESAKLRYYKFQFWNNPHHPPENSKCTGSSGRILSITNGHTQTQ